MQQEKDFMLREIQRLTLFLKKLIGKAIGLEATEIEQEIQNIESDLKGEFDLTLHEIENLDDTEFFEKINGIEEQHLENIAELIGAMVDNPHTDFGNKLRAKGVMILDYLDNNSKTFSFRRTELKNTLQHWL